MEPTYHPAKLAQEPLTPRNPFLSPAKVILVAAILVGTFLVFAPLISKSSKNSQLTLTVMHGKQVGQALLLFEEDYGVFPDDSTASLFAQDRPNSRLSGTYSNDYLRQLIVSNSIDTEDFFYVKVGRGIEKPDGNTNANLVIAAQENAWSYIIKTSGEGLSDKNEPDWPVLMTSLIAQTGNSLIFDPEALELSRGVVIRANNCAETIKLDRGGQVPASDIYPTITGSHGKDISSFHKTKILYPEGLNKE